MVKQRRLPTPAVSARAKAQRDAVTKLQQILDPGATIYWIERVGPGCDKDHIYLDPVALSGGAPIYLRELIAVLGPYPISRDVPALLIVDKARDKHLAVYTVMTRLRTYVHVEARMVMPSRWL